MTIVLVFLNNCPFYATYEIDTISNGSYIDKVKALLHVGCAVIFYF
jgi:hypothetical protein